jgi:hypothetical protein
MNINATLFVQAINFFIAYLLFRFILLKPAYRIIQQEQWEKERLEDRIAADKQLLVDMHHMRVAQWRSCQQVCKSYMPGEINKAEMFRNIVPIIAVKAILTKERHHMTDRVSGAIVSRIGRI